MSDVDDATLRLDGNAAAGALQEVFGTEMTLTPRTCTSCRSSAPLGAHHVYLHAPGIVLRCPACHDLALRIVRTPARTLVEIRGVLEIAAPLP